MYTEVEGLLAAILDGMSENHPIFLGDSAIEEKRKQYGEFMEELKKMREGKRAFTLDIVDPLANSWIYSDCAPNPDPRLEVIDYDRTWEDEALGLHDMVVDDNEVIRKNEEETKKKLESAAEKVVEEEKEDREKEQEMVKKVEEMAEEKKSVV